MQLRRLAVLAMVLLLPAVALAAPKVALTQFDGDASGDVRSAVADALDGKDLEVVAEKETNRALDKLGLDTDLSEKDARKLASDLEADAVLAATYKKAGGNKVLKVRLFVNGKKQRGFTVTFLNAKSPKFRRMLREKIVDRIASAAPEEEPERTADKGKKGKKGTKVAKTSDDEEDPLGGGKAKGGSDDDDEEGGEGDDESSDDDDEPRGKKRTASADDDEEDPDADASVSARARTGSMHSANRAAIRLDTGISVQKRSLIFNSNLPSNQAPPRFQPSPVPGARLELEVFPLAFGNPTSIASGLGAAVEYDRTLKMNVGTSNEPGVVVPVKQQHLVFGGRFRIAFGKTATSPTATLGFGYGRRTFQANRGGLMDPANLDLPDTDYKYLAPHLGLRVPLGRVVALFVEGDGMIVTNAGQIQTAEQYGRAKIFGFDTAAGLDVVIADRFAIRLSGEFVQIGYTFVGTGGVKANSRDGDPMSLDVGGAADRSVGGSVTLGVLY